MGGMTVRAAGCLILMFPLDTDRMVVRQIRSQVGLAGHQTGPGHATETVDRDRAIVTRQAKFRSSAWLIRRLHPQGRAVIHRIIAGAQLVIPQRRIYRAGVGVMRRMAHHADLTT